MTVRWRTGAAGLEGAGAASDLESWVADASFVGERLIVPLGLTRPVPWTRPAALGRMVPVLPRVRRGWASCCCAGFDAGGGLAGGGREALGCTHSQWGMWGARGWAGERGRQGGVCAWGRSGASRRDTRQNRRGYPHNPWWRGGGGLSERRAEGSPARSYNQPRPDACQPAPRRTITFLLFSDKPASQSPSQSPMPCFNPGAQIRSPTSPIRQQRLIGRIDTDPTPILLPSQSRPHPISPGLLASNPSLPSFSLSFSAITSWPSPSTLLPLFASLTSSLPRGCTRCLCTVPCAAQRPSHSSARVNTQRAPTLRPQRRLAHGCSSEELPSPDFLPAPASVARGTAISSLRQLPHRGRRSCPSNG